jgi:hypothetical protein
MVYSSPSIRFLARRMNNVMVSIFARTEAAIKRRVNLL